MSDDFLELFWTLLEDRNVEELKCSVPNSFNWSMLHPKRKTTILLEAVKGFSDDGLQEARNLSLIDWLVRSGASFSQKSGASTFSHALRKASDHDTQINIPYKGHSALSYITALKDAFKGKEIWTREAQYLTRAVDTIAKASRQRPMRKRNRTPVDEGIIEIWEKFLQAKASHDLRILAADDCVTAHAQMLREASPVVHAMLGAAMKEQKTQEIQLQDTSGSAVNLFLETLYTCSSQGDPDYNTALSALDLAHRWQVDVVVVILQDLLSELISEDSFLTIAEHAQLKGLENLKRSCQSFGAQSPTILEKVRKGKVPQLVRNLFEDQIDNSKPVKKRKSL